MTSMKKLLTTLTAALLLCSELAAGEELPFEQTEERERCAHYTETRQPFFGQTHLHTSYSADAATLQTRLTPRDAYRFARGEKVGLAPFFDTRLIQDNEAEPPVGGVTEHPYCMPPSALHGDPSKKQMLVSPRNSE